MTPADEITEAVKTLRSGVFIGVRYSTSTVAALLRARGPLANWLDSWTGIDLREDAALPEDAQHALAVARAVLGTPDQP